MCKNEISELTQQINEELQTQMNECQNDLETIKEALTDLLNCNVKVTLGGSQWGSTIIRHLTWQENIDRIGKAYISIDCYIEDEDDINVDTENCWNFYLLNIAVVMYDLGSASLTIIFEDCSSIEITECSL